MKSLYQLPLLCVFLVNFASCQYQWDCTEPDGNGEKYLPSERDRTVLSAITDGNSLHIYRVPNLNARCYGPVAAIEYCYRYSNNAGSGQPTFNWTVLILEDAVSNNFRIRSIYPIQSRGSRGSASCTNSGNVVTCCDVTSIDRFDLSMPNFIFGVTESAQGNTHGATLLGFHDGIPQYHVDTLLQNKAGLTLSVGSTIPSLQTAPRGLRMLWFIIGSSATTSPPTTPIDSATTTDTTAASTTTTSPVSTTADTITESPITTDSPTSTADQATDPTIPTASETTEPTDLPTSTTNEATEPTDTPTSTASETTESTDLPTSTTDEATEPTDTSTSTASETTEPTDLPTSTTDEATEPTDTPTSTANETTESPMSTVDETTEPTDTPTSTANETTEPTDSPMSTINEATEPTDTNTSTANETTEPTDSPMSTTNTTTNLDTDSFTQDITTQISTLPPTRTPQSELVSSNIIGPAVGGAVGGLVLVITITIVTIIALVITRRGRKGTGRGNISLTAYNNALYDAANNGDPTNLKVHLDVPNETLGFRSMSYDYVTKEEHDYSTPDEIHNGNMHAKLATQESPHITSAYTLAYANPSSYDTVAACETTLTKGTSNSEDIYMVPATNEDALYSQLSQIKTNNITRESVKLTELLGTGQFGNVHQGEWTVQGSKGKVDVAVKTLKEGAGREDKIKFLQEAAIMGQFSHPNVVKLYGVVTVGEPVMLVIELLPKGDLRDVLRNVRSEQSSEVKIDADLPHTLLSYCRQVASGMSYLSSKLFVHRDLAARNILVSEDDVCKIADFGMSRDLADTNYYVSHGGKIPVKWTAPEALHYRKYSTTSDVWSFGCVLYEIWSLGCKPFEQHSNQDCLKLIDDGVRLSPPTGCPRVIYKLMIDCWHPDSSSRPDFVSVAQQLSLPDTKLLKWSEDDKATCPEATTLGAGLDKAVDLYKDLQQRYYVTN